MRDLSDQQTSCLRHAIAVLMNSFERIAKLKDQLHAAVRKDCLGPHGGAAIESPKAVDIARKRRRRPHDLELDWSFPHMSLLTIL